MADINQLWQEYQATKQAAPVQAPVAAPAYNANAAQTYAEKLASEQAAIDVNKPKEEEARAAQIRDLESYARAVQQARQMVGGDNIWEAGWMGDKLKDFAGTDAYKLDKQLDQVRGGVALGKMAELKSTSPTGSTGFGALAVPELNLLMSGKGSLETGQGEDILSQRLANIYSETNDLYQSLTGKPLQANDPLGIRNK
jgi:hypothetical protein